jgi:hypothetical protein
VSSRRGAFGSNQVADRIPHQHGLDPPTPASLQSDATQTCVRTRSGVVSRLVARQPVWEAVQTASQTGSWEPVWEAVQTASQTGSQEPVWEAVQTASQTASQTPIPGGVWEAVWTAPEHGFPGILENPPKPEIRGFGQGPGNRGFGGGLGPGIGS